MKEITKVSKVIWHEFVANLHDEKFMYEMRKRWKDDHKAATKKEKREEQLLRLYSMIYLHPEEHDNKETIKMLESDVWRDFKIIEDNNNKYHIQIFT